MKKFFIIAALMIAAFSANAQVVRNGNNFVAEQKTTSRQASAAIETKYTYTDTDGKTYSIWISKNGRAYIIRKSAKTGNDYKKYLAEDVARTICKELNVEYKELNKAKK